MEELAIKVIDVKKKYKLGAIGGATLTEELQTKWALKRGKKDPNAMVGLDSQFEGQKEFWALKGVSFEVKKGEALGIIGFNGAGKSTLLKILSRITAPTDGEVRIKGRITSMLEVGTGFHGELTGRENIYLNGAILGMTKTEVDSKIDDIIEFSECGEFIDTPVKRYSSGMYVKLAFSVASHLDSEIMIMDEVLAVGDVKFQQKCLKKMKELVDTEGRTILFVSHNMTTVRQLCTKCIVLKKGEKIFEGDCESAIQLYLSDGVNGSGRVKNFENAHRPVSSLNKLKILTCEVIDNESLVYRKKDIINIRLNFQAKEKVSSFGIRLMLVDERGNRFASYMSSIRTYSVNTSQEYLCEMRVNLDVIEEGKYSCDIALYEIDENGEFMILDHVANAFEFKIFEHDVDRYKWQNIWWGNINLGNFEYRIMEVGDESE